jgi:ABC-type Fe3+-hydroxamate transport system substrate-binding protein
MRQLLVLAVFALAWATAQTAPVTVVDGLGRELAFDEPPQRVIALYNGNYGLLASLGVRPIGTLVNPSLRIPLYFDDAASIPSVSAAEGGIDFEVVASLAPDLILASSLEDVQAMEGIAPVYVPGDTDSLEGLYAETRNLGLALGMAERAEQVIAAFQDRFEAYKRLAPGGVSIMVAAPDGDNLGSVWLRTSVSPDCRVLNEIATCEWTDPTGGQFWSYETTPEGLLAFDPDVIYFWDAWDGTSEDLLAFLRQDPLWAEVAAVRNGRVLHVAGYTNPIASSLTAATQLLDTFAPLLYPDVFDGPLSDEEIQEILGAGR